MLADDVRSEVAPAIKAVFEQRRETETLSALERFVTAREAEIGALCDANYLEFIRVIMELMLIKEDIRIMRTSLMALNDGLQRAGQQLLAKVVTSVGS